jgi:hypothetical protein
MFGFGGLGTALTGLTDKLNQPASTGGFGGYGGPTNAQQLGGFGQQLMRMGQPHVGGAGGGAPVGGGFPSFPSFAGGVGGAGGFPGGGLFNMFNQGGAGGFMGMSPQGPQLPPQVLKMLQEKLGPGSMEGWGMGTTTQQTPTPWSSPQALIASLFNKGGQ